MKPTYRCLRGYAFDPSVSLDLDTFEINNITYKVPWEDPEKLTPGPCGEYLEVVDYDPTIKKLYRPVNLNDPEILALDGLHPSESNPQFHQQMVYAVAMLTIQNFEKALGRKIHWAPRHLEYDRNQRGGRYEVYVPKLRLYPHALREPNAYYSPLKKAILFGYFAATPASLATHMPGALVFTCLSHDIIAHEVTHAILDGLHRNYNRPTNPDVLAFHEAFADIVALFQHFTFPDVLKHQISKTRGDLEKQNLLGQLAQQFGTAIGQYGSLRDALGTTDQTTGEWIPAKPDPADYLNTIEPHGRGGILVAAVFDAFMAVYKRRIRDLLRIATGGTGVLPEGELHPDLVNRLAGEASKAASQILKICIRALDYCPPMDITFGDYLRAIITADCDTVPEDDSQYRLAFVNAFRRRGIYPEGIKTLSVESLRYPLATDYLPEEMKKVVQDLAPILRDFRNKVIETRGRQEEYEVTRDFIAGGPGHSGFHHQLIASIEGAANNASQYDELACTFSRLTGLVIQYWEDYGIRSSGGEDSLRPSFQVLDLHVVCRSSPNEEQVNQIVFGLVQRMGVTKTNDGWEHYVPPRSTEKDPPEPPPHSMEVQGGCTLIFDLKTMTLLHVIAKPLLEPQLRPGEEWPRINERRVAAQYDYQYETMPAHMPLVSQYFSAGYDNRFGEPFCLLHSKDHDHG